MLLQKRIVPALVAGCWIALSGSALAQASRPALDARAMAPGLQAAPDPVSTPKPAAGLTRNQRQEAALQARQEGALAPAGEAADPRGDRPAVPPARNRLAAATPPAPPVPAMAPPPVAPPPTTVAAAPPAAPKKRASRKAIPAKPTAEARATVAKASPVRPRVSKSASAPA